MVNQTVKIMNNGQLNGEKQVFPVVGTDKSVPAKGLSKREYFAGLAMQGLCATYENMEQYSVNGGHLEIDQIAKDAVNMSDALLKALEKPQS